MGVCQWISIAGRLDICFAVSSLSRFAANPREGHLHRAIKILGYLKKYPSRGYIIDPGDSGIESEYKEIVPAFGNQYADFKEDIDHRLPEAKMKQLPITRYTDANQGHDQVTGKSITGILPSRENPDILVVKTSSLRTDRKDFGIEFIALKRCRGRGHCSQTLFKINGSSCDETNYNIWQ